MKARLAASRRGWDRPPGGQRVLGGPGVSRAVLLAVDGARSPRCLHGCRVIEAAQVAGGEPGVLDEPGDDRIRLRVVPA